MKRPILALTAASALALASIAQAADLDVIASNGVRAALEEARAAIRESDRQQGLDQVGRRRSDAA